MVIRFNNGTSPIVTSKDKKVSFVKIGKRWYLNYFPFKGKLSVNIPVKYVESVKGGIKIG